jgi:hypothetical protein
MSYTDYETITREMAVTAIDAAIRARIVGMSRTGAIELINSCKANERFMQIWLSLGKKAGELDGYIPED